ncbi:hypothetical protein SEPCBS57363_000406 [Sporothrix epigloea]|uniref:Pentatricopeptide repeat protein n=1 Tax=Sporothrix epigloea TaxID=1892477 RepID=A0ABP0D4G9_9PEZI
MARPSPPLPVPSKAAIQALRGLVLGTTCTLALVTEDRRRRINVARSAIQNGDRIRSARQYYPGGNAFAISLEEESLSVEPGAIHWQSQSQSQQGQSSNRDRIGVHEPLTPTNTSITSKASDAMLVPVPLKRKLSPSGHPSEHTSEVTISCPPTTNPIDSAHTIAPLRSESQTQSTVTSAPSSSPRLFAYPAMANRIQNQPRPLEQQSQEYTALARLGRLSRHNGPSVEESGSRPIADAPAETGRVKELNKTGSKAELRAALRALSASWRIADISSDERIALGKASANLCRSCQKAGHMDLAQEVLQLAVCYGQLDEATYLAHQPFPVVLSLAPLNMIRAGAVDAESEAALGETDWEANRDIFVRRLQGAVSLFLPTSSSLSCTQPELSKNLIQTAKKLLKCAIAVNDRDLINGIYLSITRCTGDFSDFSKWYSSKIEETGDPALLVSFFIAQPPLPESLSKHSFYKLGDRIVRAARLSHHVQAGHLFATLIALSASTSIRLRTSWVTELLFGHWQTTKDYNEIQRLFDMIKRQNDSRDGAAAATCHFDGAYRVMIQVALEAGRHAEAEALFSQLTAIKPSASHDIRVQGLFVLDKAKRGDWQGVQDDLQQCMKVASTEGLNPRDAERIFVPIAKEYVRTHTIGETEDFLKMNVEEVGIPLGRYMVTLLANEYGALREVRSFVAWLEYCAQAGFAVDAAFSNAILLNCRKHWKFGFYDLRTMYRKLRLLCPDFEDTVTQNIMTHAAVSSAKGIARPETAKGRVLSLRVGTPAVGTTATSNGAKAVLSKSGKLSTSPLSESRNFSNEDDLYVSMKQAFASGKPAKVVRMYKHAMRGGMPASTKCLKFAVGAAIKSGQSRVTQSNGHVDDSTFDPSMAIDLLETAHAAGHETDAAASYLAVAYIDATSPKSPQDEKRQSSKKASVAMAVKSILLRLNACGVEMSDLALNRAAFHMYKVGHMNGAIALALSAADLPVGGGRRGYNVWNYSVLILAYVRNADALGIRLATEGAAANGVLSETTSYKVLKQARRRLRHRQLELEATMQESASCDAEPVSHQECLTDAGQSHVQHLDAALDAIEDALELARAARQQLNIDRRNLEQEAMRIMQQAALGAESKLVESDRIQHLPKQQSVSYFKGGKSCSASSASDWDMLDLPIDEEGRLIDEAMPAPCVKAAGTS